MSEIPRLHSKIEYVEPDSVAAQAGIRAGDRALSLNGQPLRDIIDYQYHLEAGDNDLEIDREGRRLAVRVHAPAGADPGISFAAAIFDHVRTCRSRCIFCFIDQLPRGLRRPLYFKDDDFRLSFLYGNFITLGNLREDDIERIVEQRLSPLYVSVHATDTGLRARLMGLSVADAAQGLDILHRLGEAGIATHIQVVLCPGINDGPALEQTVMDLSDKFPLVASVGIVPVAVGQSSLLQAPQPVTSADCEEVIRSVTVWQQRFRQERGVGFVYAADEFYLKADQPLPGVEAYDDFLHYENGIGIAANFVAEAGSIVGTSIDRSGSGGSVYLLTGILASGLMRNVAKILTNSLAVNINALVVENHTFGPHVTVTGLLGGKDILDAALTAALGPGDRLLIPRGCVNDGAGVSPIFIDDMTLGELKEALGCEVIVA